MDTLKAPLSIHEWQPANVWKDCFIRLCCNEGMFPAAAASSRFDGAFAKRNVSHSARSLFYEKRNSHEEARSVPVPASSVGFQ